MTHTFCPLCNAASVAPYRRLSRTYGQAAYDLVLGRCTQCHFVLLLNPPAIEYDADYLAHEHVITINDELACFRAQERLAGIERFVPPQPERRFLDVGIGDGLLLNLAEAAGYATYGLDINPASVDLARRHYRLRADIRLGTPEETFDQHTFDIIHMNEVIEHIAEPMPLLNWCARHLRYSGLLVVQTGNIDSLASHIKGAQWDYFRPVHVSYFSTRSLSWAITQVGLRIVYIRAADWRLRPTLRAVLGFARQRRWLGGAGLFGLYLSALPHGIRRTVLIYAMQ